jgi:hypothetical protein
MGGGNLVILLLNRGSTWEGGNMVILLFNRGLQGKGIFGDIAT